MSAKAAAAPLRDLRARRRGRAPDRTTLWWLIAALAAVLLPHLGRVPAWYLPVFALAVAERMAHEYVRRPPLPSWLRLAATAAAAAAIALQYGTLLGRQAGVALLCVMIALKLTETYRRRDVYFLVSLGYFVAVTQFLFSQSIYLVIYILAAVVLITGTLVVHEVQPSRMAGSRVGNQGWLQTLRSVLIMTAQGVPLMLVLFVLFPRLDTPLWGMPEDAADARTGVGDEMSPGDLLELFVDDSPALRARFEGPLPPADALYWRGPVLWNFDGRTWRRPGRQFLYGAEVIPERIRDPVRYSVTMEPSERPWIFALDVPVELPDWARLQLDHTAYRERPIIDLLAYDAVSDPGYRMQRELPRAMRDALLALPAGFNPRTRALGETLRAGTGGDTRAIVTRALAMLEAEDFVYSYSPPPLGRHTADEFLFETREGFCEYYASAYTILMRAAGVPARVVLGYQGGTWIQAGDYLLVRNSDAHAWTEVWFEDRGWVRVDPTAQAAPERIITGAREALGGRGMLDSALLRALRNRLDAVHNFWNEWVLEFDRRRQDSLFERAGMDGFQSTATVVGLVAVIAVVMALITHLVLRGEWLGGFDAAGREYAKFCRKLARGGLARRPAEGPRDLARRALRAFPGEAQAIRRITRLYIDLRYAGAADGEDLRRLRRAVRRFQRKPRRRPPRRHAPPA